MKIYNLAKKSRIYTSNVYLVKGSADSEEDVSALVDVGCDPAALELLLKFENTRGKKQIEKVVLTNSHRDHTSILSDVKSAFNSRVYACSKILRGVDIALKNGETIKLGDRFFEVIYTPGERNDLICLYCRDEGVLFAGDASVIPESRNFSYSESFALFIEKLCRLDVKTIYFGHGEPMYEGCSAALSRSLDSIRSRLNLNTSVNVN